MSKAKDLRHISDNGRTEFAMASGIANVSGWRKYWPLCVPNHVELYRKASNAQPDELEPGTFIHANGDVVG
jgi:hypothetical protein